MGIVGSGKKLNIWLQRGLNFFIISSCFVMFENLDFRSLAVQRYGSECKGEDLRREIIGFAIEKV